MQLLGKKSALTLDLPHLLAEVVLHVLLSSNSSLGLISTLDSDNPKENFSLSLIGLSTQAISLKDIHLHVSIHLGCC